MPLDPKSDRPESDANESAKFEKLLIAFFILFLIAVFLIPSEVLLKWSMWWNHIN
jgi:hypothetical protein